MEKLNVDFKNTCKLLFRQEIGELPEFAPYLSEYMMPYAKQSAPSGKGMLLSGGFYPQGASYALHGEQEAGKSPPFSINDIKDIDSLFRAASERAVYCGNKLFGKNLGVEMSDNCSDCIDMYHCTDTYSSKNAAYCSLGRFSESLYGTHMFWKVRHSMRCSRLMYGGAARCFEAHLGSGLSDCYYAYNCSDCVDCMFCFSLRSKSHCIGNLQLSRGRYSSLKAKLLAELANMLVKNKRAPSISEIAAREGGSGSGETAREPPSQGVCRAFGAASKIVLGKEHTLPGKVGWLESKSISRKRIRGRFGTPTLVFDSPETRGIPHSSYATLAEALSKAISISIAEGETPSFAEIAQRAGKIALFTNEYIGGNLLGVKEVATAVESVDTQSLFTSMKTSYSGYSTVVTESKHCFGGHSRVLYSEFCINCFNVTHCHGCFECDACQSCRSCYFCHNCENVEEGILCFNLKGARYAVLNQPVSKEEFARVKRMLLDYVNRELEAKGRLERGIFALAPAKMAKK